LSLKGNAMHILIDREMMYVLYKHPNMMTLDNIRHIECKQACVIGFYDANETGFGSLTDLELRLLYRNLTGYSFSGYSIPHLRATLAAMLENLPISDINPVEAELQALSIPMDDEGDYKYVRGSATPAPQNVLFPVKPLMTTHVAVPYIAPPPVVEYVPPPAPEPKERKSREPRDPNVTYDQPDPESKTGKVWVIADQVYAELGPNTDWKLLRKRIVEQCEKEGINSSTASVQSGKWRHTKLGK
jgi:hypothetical protein